MLTNPQKERRRHNSTFRIRPRGFKRKSYDWRKPSKLKRSRLKTRAPRKGSGRAVKQECDQLVREILTLRDESCVNFGCGRTEGLHVGHYITRKVLALRWNLQNCNLQCDFHNEAHNTDPKPYHDAMFLLYGVGVTWRIEGIAQDNPRLTHTELLEIRDGLKEELARLQRQRGQLAA